MRMNILELIIPLRKEAIMGATAEDVLAEMDISFDGTNDNHGEIDVATTGLEKTIAQLDQVRSTTEELQEQTVALRYEDKVAIINVALDKSNEAQSQISTAKESLLNAKTVLEGAISTLREAQTCIQSLINLATTAPAPVQATPAQIPIIFSGGPPEVILDKYPYGKIKPPSEAALDHICDGHPTKKESGGHLHGTGRPGKTEFPDGWGRLEISEALTAVANLAENPRHRKNGEWYAQGTFQNVTVNAVVQPDGSITAGWPVRGPGVICNPELAER